MLNRAVTNKFRDFLTKTKFSKDDFVARYIDGKWYKPKYSLRKQADMYKSSIILGLDPIKLNIPVPAPHKTLQQSPPEGTKYQKNYLERKAKVDAALKNMPKTIAKWKSELEAENTKKISNLPF
ncbi:hypothetical protein DSO57_1001683 [Entomophthora muscae]|uniref:Uncharacterized protein n=2 Tax=Entomophthora muscae TaxID=34485 RepID=A0ACC2TXI6_9FUNG|nr:hypothetical protein DSO57_1025646 [Entomophthora muscae]KAJ9078932.1 hypothetical protein DSO57_1001683 [Entomophthora muscae]